jgi:hypothetical protein
MTLTRRAAQQPRMSGGQMQVPFRHSKPLQHCPGPLHE